jgi:hypothetical protein
MIDARVGARFPSSSPGQGRVPLYTRQTRRASQVWSKETTP